MALPVVAFAKAEAEGCDGLAYKDIRRMTFAGCNAVAKHAPSAPNYTNHAVAGSGGWRSASAIMWRR